MRLRLRALATILLVLSTIGAQLSAQRAGVTSPVLVKDVKPQYTQAAREARIQGNVTLDAIVLADGTVGEVTVTKSLDKEYGLDDQAVKAMKQWEFKPGTKDGKPVAVRVSVEMSFTLK